jgi:hypothetical protein
MANWLNITVGAAIAVGYLTFSWSATGSSVGKQIAGLRVVDRGGHRLSLWRSFAQAVLSVLLPAGLLWILASRRAGPDGSRRIVWMIRRMINNLSRRPPHRPLTGAGVPGADSAGRIVGTSCFHCRHGR